MKVNNEKIIFQRKDRQKPNSIRRKGGSVWLRLLIIFLNIFVFVLLTNQIFKRIQPSTRQCNQKSFPLGRNSSLVPSTYQELEGSLSKENHCFYFEFKAGQKIKIKHNVPIKVVRVNGDRIVINEKKGTHNFEANLDDWYIIYALGTGKLMNYKINVSIGEQSIDAREIGKPAPRFNAVDDELSPYFDGNEEAYQIPQESMFPYSYYPPFQLFPPLENIVSQSVSIAENRGISADSISVSLIDLTQLTPDSQIPFAEHKGSLPRYPASIVKLFWMVMLYSQHQNGFIPQADLSEQDVHDMIFKSDNEAASRILDLITNTTSGENLPKKELKQWIDKRKSVNRFFESAGYLNVNISQKTFPIPYLNLNEPTGRELQMRGDQSSPERNFLTTTSVARLLFEIAAHQSVSPISEPMLGHLKRNLNPNEWKQVPFNSIEGFLGEALPPNAYLASKAGWTSETRHDAAIISSPERDAYYILVVFGEGEKIADDEDILPLISKMVYQNMTSRQP